MVVNGAVDPEESGWDFEDEDEASAVLAAVGRQIKLWRQAAGLSQPEFGKAIGYGENLVYKVETGQRIPRPEFLDRSDEALGAEGKISAMKQDVAEIKYPKKLRDLTKLEKKALEIGAYGSHNIHGLLQTREYAEAAFDERRPVLSSERYENLVAARMLRQEVFTWEPMTTLTFVQEQVTLERPIGGPDVLRRQLLHILKLSRQRNVEFQVMPTGTSEHAGLSGEFQLLKLRDGSAIGYSETQLTSRLVDDPKQVQVLELRYGIIRSQALSPRRSQEYIEKLLGET
ncbi:helix-turn-helix transcriptional regulator [Streptomyces sp. NPDC049954]|uniref:helix-turn-helix domain-containing protein n=1 Tax=Streptomyces sp. NPDC049954 TaxID=3155779 RepID=UPI00341BB5BB